jgi:hypothetical protein
MEKKKLTEGIIFVAVGVVLLLVAFLTESIFDGIFAGFSGGALGVGIMLIIKYFRISSPQNAEKYRKIEEQKDIAVHDELNIKLRDQSCRIVYKINFWILCLSMPVFSILGAMGVVKEYKIIVMYLFALLVAQVVLGCIVFNQLRKKYC